MFGRFFNALEADEVISTNPMRGVKLPPMEEDKRPHTPLADAEYSLRLLNACA